MKPLTSQEVAQMLSREGWTSAGRTKRGTRAKQAGEGKVEVRWLGNWLGAAIQQLRRLTETLERQGCSVEVAGSSDDPYLLARRAEGGES